jgi:hypothetical protein
MALFTPKCPVAEREQAWIHDSLSWFRGEFGDDPLRAPVVLPTSEYFPPPYQGTDDDVRALVSRVAGYMGVQADLTVRFSDDVDHVRNLQQSMLGGMARSSGAAGTYQRHDGQPLLTIDRSTVADPVRLVTVIAHELGHVRLLGEERITAERVDHEPLTDLLTVYLRMGVFTANSAFGFSQHSDGRRIGWQAQRLGYLTEQMFGYGLACLAMLRGESDPSWSKYLDTNPRVYVKNSIRYLRHHPVGWPTAT